MAFHFCFSKTVLQSKHCQSLLIVTQIYGKGTAKSLGSHFSMAVPSSFVGLLSALCFLSIISEKISPNSGNSATTISG